MKYKKWNIKNGDVLTEEFFRHIENGIEQTAGAVEQIAGAVVHATPESFGAVGNGVANDTTAVQAAVDSGLPVQMTGTYLITSPIRITRDHVVIDGHKATVLVKNNFAFKAEARHFNISIGKCVAVDGRGSVTTTPIFPAGSGFFLFDANFNVERSDVYWYSYGYGNVFIGEARFLEYGIRIAPAPTASMCGLEYTVFSGNDLWCEKCIDLSPVSENHEGWANQNTFNNFRLRGKFGVFIGPNKRWTVNGNTFYRCGLEGFVDGGAGIYCNGVSNTFHDLRNAEQEALGAGAKWVSLGADAELNKFEFYGLNMDYCYIADSAYQNDFNCILSDANAVYQGLTNHNYTIHGCFVAPDCYSRWIKATGGPVDLGRIATPVTICSVPESENVVIWLPKAFGHLGIREFTVIITHGAERVTMVMDAAGNLLRTFNNYGTYRVTHNAYTGEWEAQKVIADIHVDSAADPMSGNLITNAAATQYVDQSVAAVPYTGDNLYTGTRDFNGERWINRAYWYERDDETYSGFKVLYNPGQWTGLHQRIYVKGGSLVTFSAFVKTDKAATVNMYVQTSSADDANVDGTAHGAVAEGITTEWTRYSKTFKVWSDGYISPRLENTTEGATLYICGIKLEYGGKATPWTDAWQDRANGPVLTSPSGKTYRLTINDAGTVEPIEVTL